MYLFEFVQLVQVSENIPYPVILQKSRPEPG